MIRKIISLFLAFILVFPAESFAQILPDGTTMTRVDYSALNKTPVLNIAAPSGKGVSHNKFTSYGVGPSNLIINNTKQDGLQSKLGGYLQGNPNLIKADKEAQIILNEVTGVQPTALEGYTEILGRRAELIIANPNGIHVSGAGFINTSKLSLITGAARMSGGDIAGFNLSRQGKIRVAGQNTPNAENVGLNGRELDELNLVSRGIVLDGGVYAPQINVFTGNNQYDYDAGQISSTESNSETGEFAVDAGALGGMYGGRIHIVGTEKGFGVRSRGGLVADVDDISIANNGDIAIDKASANGDIRIQTQASAEIAESYAKNNISITAAQTLRYDTLRASKDITLSAQTVNHLHNAEAGQNFTVTADTLNVTDTARPDSDGNVLLSYGDVNLNVGTLNNASEIAAYKNLRISSAALQNNGRILADQNVNISGGNIFNNKDAAIYASDTVTVATDGSVYNVQGDILGEKGVNVGGLGESRAALLENRAGNIESRSGDIHIYAREINNLSLDNCDPSQGACHTVTMTPTGLKASYWGPKHVVKYKAEVTSNLEALDYGVIAAADKLYLNAGDVRNISSKMAAGGSLEAFVDNAFRNESSSYVTQVRDIMEEGWRKRCAMGSKYCYRRSLYNGALYDIVVNSKTGAVVAAPNVELTAGIVGNGTKEDNPALPWAEPPVNERLENAALTGIVDPVALTDFGAGGMFKAGRPDGKYLYVTDNRFINVYDFIGSNYFSQKMGLNTDLDGAKWLGDPVYEQRMLERAILDVTGSHYLYDGVADSNEQMKILYDNAFDAYHAGLGLEVGRALTEEQIARLKNNIIWYVEREIDGQKVLVPTLYIAGNGADNFLSGAESVIKGDDVSVEAAEIENSGNIEGKTAELYASGSVKNIGGVIFGSERVNLNAGEDIVIETKLNTFTARGANVNYGEIPQNHDYLASGQTSSWLGRTAGVYGGEITAGAGGNVSLKAAEIVSDGAASLSARGGVTVGAHALDNSLWANRGDKDRFETSSVTHAGSGIAAGGDLNITSGKNTVLQGSDIVGFGNVNLTGENVNIVSAVDSSHTYAKTSDGGAFGKTTREWLDDSQTHRGSSVGAAGDIHINAVQNATVLASSLGGLPARADTGGGSINLTAGENVSILSGENYEASMRNTEKSAFFGIEAGKDKVYDEIRTREASSVFADKDLHIKSGKDVTVQASDAGARGDGTIETGGDLNVLSAAESAYHEEYHYKKGFGGFVADFDNGRASVGVAAEKNEKTEKSYQETARSSTLDFGGKLSVNSQGNVFIAGSDVLANEIDVLAKNISVMSAEELSTYSVEDIRKRIEATVGVSNAYVNAGLAVYAVVEAEKALEEAVSKLKRAKENPRIKDYSDYETNVQLATAGLASAIIAAAAAAAGAAGNSMSLGMSADVQVKADVNKDTYENQSKTQRQSTLLARGGDINLTAQEDILQRSSQAVSGQGNISYQAGGNITIEAAADTYSEKSSHESYTDTVTVGNSNTSANHAQDKSKSKYDSTSWVNSGVSAANGTVTLASGKDTTVKGGNVYGEEVLINTGGKLTVESLQDEIHAESDGNGFSVGASKSGSGNFGLNNSDGYTDSAWVSNQTGIIGTKSVDITADSTHVKGGLIANVTEEGADGGNLRLTTNSLTAERLEDYYQSENESAGFNIGVSGINDPLELAKHPQGSVGVNMSRSGEERAQDTNATIGLGSLTVGGEEAGEIDGLNRDISKSQELIKDELTGGLDGGLTADLRLLDPTGAGQKQIFDEVKNLPKRLMETAGLSAKAAGTIAQAVGSFVADVFVSAGENKAAEHPAGTESKESARVLPQSAVPNAVSGGVGLEEEPVYTSKPQRSIVVEPHTNDDGSTTVKIILTQVTVDENGEIQIKQATKEQRLPAPKEEPDSGLVFLRPSYDIVFSNLSKEDESALFAQVFDGGYDKGKRRELNYNAFNSERTASLPDEIKEMVSQAKKDVNEYLAATWDKSEAKAGLLGVHSAFHNSIAGRTIDGTINELNNYVTPVADLAGYGLVQAGEAAGVWNQESLGTDWYYAPYSTGIGALEQQISQLPEERQQDLSLLSDGLLLWGGVRGVGKGVGSLVGETGAPTVIGGTYSEVKGVIPHNHAHHIISAQAGKESGVIANTNKMGAVSMPADIHKQTATYGRGAKARSSRTQEIAGLQTNPRSTLATGAREVRKLLLDNGVDRTTINKAVQNAIKASKKSDPSVYKKIGGSK